ncbi:hypothetical protein LUZ60_008396 [Juncus effusus]|nr:hypothetical protein LUZ60_008396 [Juncus effusus]
MEYQYAMEKKGAGNGDHFIVEDLLDFSNDDVEAPEEEMRQAEVVDEVVGLNFSAESSSVTAGDSCNSSFSGEAVVAVGRSLNGASFSGELCEPQYDELAELEWLSNFVEESFSTEDLQKLHLISASGIKSNTTISSNTLPTLKVKPEPISTTIPSPSSSSVTDHTKSSHTIPSTSDPNLFRPLPAKARSKRSRSAGPSNWASRLILLSPDPNPSDLLKKPKKRFAPPPVNPAPFNNSASSEGRRCLHCQTDKTPQWRTGPMGPKTLCNACGVRYKSGRLVPEYRPASSPTFIVAKHSNSHRKVLELRRQKEVQLQQLQHQQIMMHGTTPVHGQNGDEFLIHHRIGLDYRQLI